MRKKDSTLLTVVLVAILLILYFKIFHQEIANTEYSPEKSAGPRCYQLSNQIVYPIVAPAGPDIRSEPRPRFQHHAVVGPTPTTAEYDVLIVLHSKFRNFRERNQFRKIFDTPILQQLNARLLFVLGSTPNNVIAFKEIQRTNDVLIVNTIEHYHNQSYKALAWIDYALSLQKLPKIVLKLDDDLVVDKAGIEYLIKRFSRHTKPTVACRVLSNGPVTWNNQSKWYLSREEYKDTSLGTFCQGMVYLLSGSLLPLMKQNVERVQMLWMDDWYVTRALLKEVNHMFHDISTHIWSSNSESDFEERTKRMNSEKQRIILGHFRANSLFPFAISRRNEIWNEIKEAEAKCTDFNLFVPTTTINYNPPCFVRNQPGCI